MLLGVCLFVAAYTAVSSHPRVLDWVRVPPVRRTMVVGYGLRVGVSIVYPVGLALDLFPGVMSVRLVKAAGLTAGGFVDTLATTVVQGGLLNILLAVVMLPIYLVQRRLYAARLRRDGADDPRRGFEVVVNGARAGVSATSEPTPTAAGDEPIDAESRL